MKIGVTIPSKTEFESLANLAVQLDEQDPHAVVFVDNGYEPPLHAPDHLSVSSTFQIIRDETPSIYTLWNRGYERLVELGCDRVVILNDDIVLEGEDWLERLCAPLGDEYWVTCPDYTRADPLGVTPVRGVWRHGGMCGWAFAVNVERVGSKPFDEGFSYWYGDDAFSFGIERSGGMVGRVGGLYLEHIQSATLNQVDVSAEIAQDTARFRALWGDR